MLKHKKVILIIGEPASGKSTSLMNLRDQENTIYFNCEGGGKMLPFASDMVFTTVSDPDVLLQRIKACSQPDFIHPVSKKPVKRIIIDGLNFLMDMCEVKFVNQSSEKDKFKGWVLYGNYFTTLMQDVVAKSDLECIFLAHTFNTYDQFGAIVNSSVPVKGNTKTKGIEAFFTMILQAKLVKLQELESFENKLLNITEVDTFVKSKYVFKTIKTEDYEKIRTILNLFKPQEMYIDNDVQAVLDRIDEYNNQ